jgi:putative copper export protein
MRFCPTFAAHVAERFGPEAADGFLRDFSGWAIFLVALVLVFGGHRILQHILPSVV